MKAIKAVAGSVLAGVAILLMTGVAMAQYPPTGSLTIDDATVVPGQAITLTASGFSGGIGFTYFSTPVSLGSATAGADGVAVLRTRIPENTTLGTHTITASGTGTDGRPQTASVNVRVVAPGAADAGAGAVRRAPGRVALTGTDTVPLLQYGSLLVATGAVALILGRRQRSKTNA